MLIVADFDNQVFIIEKVKKLIVVLVAAFSIITACMIYLIKAGVSLRLGRVIEPTPMSLSNTEISRAIISRLMPVFQPSKFVLFGIDKEDEKVRMLVQSLEVEFKSAFGSQPQIVTSDSAEFSNCKKPCWIMSSPGDSTHLQKSELIEMLQRTGESYFTLSVLRFDRDTVVPKHCEVEKRITIDCVTPLAVREARRKIKQDSPYFFMRNYNEKDYFLFLEN